jgi:hypothetical protein
MFLMHKNNRFPPACVLRLSSCSVHSTYMGWIWVTEPGLLAISADGVVVVCAVGGEIVSCRQSAHQACALLAKPCVLRTENVLVY